MSGVQDSNGNLASTLLSVIQDVSLQQEAITSRNLHPFAMDAADSAFLLRQIIDATSHISQSIEAHMSLPLSNPKLLSTYRQHASISHSLHLSDQNVRNAIACLRKRSGITYGEDIPLDRSIIADWCLSRLEMWGSLAGMEAFREAPEGGRTTVLLGGKVLVVEIDLSIDESTPEQPMLSVTNLKTSYAITDTVTGSNTQGSLSLDGFLADRLRAFLKEVQKDADEQDNVEAARLGSLFSEQLTYLMRLDHLALGEDSSGLRWFTDVDALACKTEQLAVGEAEAINATQANTLVPLDLFLLRAHTLPLPFLINPSISFLTYLSPLAYLSLLRASTSRAPQYKPNLPKIDIPFDVLRSRLVSHGHEMGATVATLVLSSTKMSAQNDDGMDIPHIGLRPALTLTPGYADMDHILPLPTAVAASEASLSWILDFTDGGKHAGVVMSQSRMREIELVVNPLSPIDNLDNVPITTFGTGSWVDLLVNPKNPVSPERYTAQYISPSPTSAHPPLQLRLTAPPEPGFFLERVPVKSLKEVWGVLEVVREQCWLNEILRGRQWAPEGIYVPDQYGDTPDADVTTSELEAVLKGTMTPRRMPVNVYLPSAPPNQDALFDTGDISAMSLGHSPRAKIVMSSPERPPIPGSVEISVTFEPSRPRGIMLDIRGAMGADLNTDVLEEVCRRGGTLGLPGRVWAQSHGVA